MKEKKEQTLSSLGIDISKTHLDVCHLPSRSVARYTNDLEGIDSLLSWIQNILPGYIIFEPSGGYEKLLVETLHSQGIPFSMVNAGKIRHFAKAKGLLCKTDKIDAMSLADYGIKMKPRSLPVKSVKIQKLREWLKARKHTLNSMKFERQRLEHKPCEGIQSMILENIERLKDQKKTIEKQIQDIIDECAAFSSQQQSLCQEKGIGPMVSATLIGELPELGRCSHQQIAALVGVAPYNHDSGTFKGYRKTKGGRKNVRAVLYMAVISAIRSNPKIKEFYLRLRENGKKPKVALTACMRKLLIILNAMLRNKYSEES